MSTTPLNIVVVGHVDHGKSTLVGRLLHDTGTLPEGKLEALRAAGARRGMPFEWAFLMDALQAERDQGITIDTTRIRFRSGRRPYLLIDAPGHKEFLKNMVSGAAAADAAVLVVDAVEGMREQSRRHGYLLHLLGLRQIVVVVNKMDAVGHDRARFLAVAEEVVTYLGDIGAAPAHVVPVAARDGDNLATRSPAMPWYDGPTLIEALDEFTAPPAPAERPLRLPVQDVYKLDERRIVAGRIESGRLRIGDELLFLPANKTARIASIESWGADAPAIAASAGQSIGITLDEPIFVERGQIASHREHHPALAHLLRARLFWLGRAPLAAGNRYRLKLATAEYPVEVAAIERVVDVEDLSGGPAATVERNAVAEVTLRSRALLALDTFSDSPRTGRFVLVDGHDIVGGGTVAEIQRNLAKATNVHAVDHAVSVPARAAANGHLGGVVWLTGLSGAGKSTIAMEVERALFAKGWQVYVIDGDNVRHGLNSDLGFSPDDRAENIRRVGEVANLFAQAGMVVITAFISPYRADRDRVRAMAPAAFHEVHIEAALAECERRDPKGLYRKARAGKIAEFTGIDAPYEPPPRPELTIDTAGRPVAESVARLTGYIEANLAPRSSGGPVYPAVDSGSASAVSAASAIGK